MQSQIRRGQAATVWVEEGDYQRARTDISVWQLAVDGRMVLSYQERAVPVNRQIAENQQTEPFALAALAASISGLVFLFVRYLRRVTRRPAPA